MSFLSVWPGDWRVPAPDVRGGLADLQVRTAELRALNEHTRCSWPDVTAIRCGFRDSTPYFTIHIRKFSREAQEQHWPLADWIRDVLGLTDCEFFFQPPVPDDGSSAITVYTQ